MNLRLYNDGGGSERDTRLRDHVQYALALGEGGSAAWLAMNVCENVARIETELDAIGGDMKQVRLEYGSLEAEGAQDDDPRWDDLEARAQRIAHRLELHVWRRCMHLATRISSSRSTNPESVRRFIGAVGALQALWAEWFDGEPCQILLAGVYVRPDTADKLQALFAARREEREPAMGM